MAARKKSPSKSGLWTNVHAEKMMKEVDNWEPVESRAEAKARQARARKALGETSRRLREGKSALRSKS